jgi:hypothetical protein
MTKMALAVLLLAGQRSFAQTGWKLSSLTSPMDDNSGIILTATQIPLEGATAPSAPTGLSIQCSKKNGLEILLRTYVVVRESGNVSDPLHKGLIGGLSSKHPNASLSHVRIRFDQQKAKAEEWMLGADTSNLFAQKPKKILDALLKDQVQELIVEVQPAGRDPEFFKFDVRGLDQYKAMLHEKCGY